MRIENLKSIIILSLIVFFSLSGTYAYMQLVATNNTATGQGGCFEVAYVGGQAITGASLVSTTNYLEGAHTQITLSKASNCKIYTEAQIMLSINTSTTTIPLNRSAFKYKILNGSTTVSTGTISTANPTLANITLTNTATTYDIYLWIDSSISYGYYDNKTFSGYLYATSSQTSTIKQ